MNEISALASLRALRNQILAKLEQSEEFRVLRGIEFILARETRLPQGQAFPPGQTVQPGARAVQGGLAANVATAPFGYPSSVAADEPSFSFPNGADDKQTGPQEAKPLDFPQARTAS